MAVLSDRSGAIPSWVAAAVRRQYITLMPSTGQAAAQSAAQHLEAAHLEARTAERARLLRGAAIWRAGAGSELTASVA